MRELTVMEMDAVSGGERSRVQNAGKCVMDVVAHGAAGGAAGALRGGVLGAKIGLAIGMISAVIGSDACNAALN